MRRGLFRYHDPSTGRGEVRVQWFSGLFKTTMPEERYSAKGIQPHYHQLPWSADRKVFIEIKGPLS
jgi:hypothetical protein